MKERGDEGIPPIGARMPYVVVAGSSPKLSERTEHPAYVKANPSMRLDYLYYVTSLQAPVLKLLQFADVRPIQAMFAAAKERARNHNLGIGNLRGLLLGGGGDGQGHEEDLEKDVNSGGNTARFGGGASGKKGASSGSGSGSAVKSANLRSFFLPRA
jgi:hypothetical protein